MPLHSSKENPFISPESRWRRVASKEADKREYGERRRKCVKRIINFATVESAVGCDTAAVA